jgi:hypothetical protein
LSDTKKEKKKEEKKSKELHVESGREERRVAKTQKVQVV